MTSCHLLLILIIFQIKMGCYAFLPHSCICHFVIVFSHNFMTKRKTKILPYFQLVKVSFSRHTNCSFIKAAQKIRIFNTLNRWISTLAIFQFYLILEPQGVELFHIELYHIRSIRWLCLFLSYCFKSLILRELGPVKNGQSRVIDIPLYT